LSRKVNVSDLTISAFLALACFPASMVTPKTAQ
jgi:hypothetical protein